MPTATVPVFDLDGISWLRGDEDCLHGQVEMGGILFHANALKVRIRRGPHNSGCARRKSPNFACDCDHSEAGTQVGTKDPYGRLDDLSRLQGEGVFRTVKITGHPGDWIVWFAPHQQ